MVVGSDAREVLVGVVEAEAPAAVMPNVDDVALPPSGIRHHPMSGRQYQRILVLFRKFEEFLGERRRVHQSAEQHRELAPLGIG